MVFMNYPLDTSCNKELKHSPHQRSCVVAYAAYCAGVQGKFWEYHDKAFARQPKFQDASLENIAEKLNLDMNQFKACLSSEPAQQAIQADLQQGGAAKVQGTPTVFVNGRKFQPWMSKKAWKKLIERLNGAPGEKIQ
jgi:protein-disulfide isomerase